MVPSEAYIFVNQADADQRIPQDEFKMHCKYSNKANLRDLKAATGL